MIITSNPCTACGACVSACPKNCIDIKKNSQGFYMPFVDEKQCVHCNNCAHVCPANTRPLGHPWEDGKYVACWAKDNFARFSGSSGGIFGLFASHILNQNGVVFGAAFSEDFKSVYQTSTRSVSLEQLKKSKYVESYTGSVFKAVKKELLSGSKVLYCGTSCQIDGLKSYLKTDYPNLITCDFLCHGVSAAGLYEKYVCDLENKYGSIKNLAFRSKAYGWKAYCVKADFQNGKKYLKTRFQDPYLRTFFENTAIRDACFSCNRLHSSNADITIGDYWKVAQSPEIKDTNQGVSLVGIHTEKGQHLMDLVADQCEVYPLDRSKYSYAYSRSTQKPHNREAALSSLYQTASLFRVKVSPKTRLKGYIYWARAVSQKMTTKGIHSGKKA